MSYTYTTFVAALSQEVAISSGNSDFVSMIPTFIQNAELRILRDLDLISTIFRDPYGSISVNSRNVPIPSTNGKFVVIEGANLSLNFVRLYALIPVSREFIDMLYPSDTAVTGDLPKYYALDNDTTMLIAPPTSYSSYAVEVVGTIRPTSLSPSYNQTFISMYLPDLFLAAAMVEAAGWAKNYGAQSDDPKLAVSWESRYQSLLGPARTEEIRKKYGSDSWTAKYPVAVSKSRG